MNLLTRSVLEDLIKMDTYLCEITTENIKKTGQFSTHNMNPHPAFIIAKIMGLTSDEYDEFISELLEAVHLKKITITEAIDQLAQARQLTPSS